MDEVKVSVQAFLNAADEYDQNQWHYEAAVALERAQEVIAEEISRQQRRAQLLADYAG